jgi:hypothetical protein
MLCGEEIHNTLFICFGDRQGGLQRSTPRVIEKEEPHVIFQCIQSSKGVVSVWRPPGDQIRRALGREKQRLLLGPAYK